MKINVSRLAVRMMFAALLFIALLLSFAANAQFNQFEEPRTTVLLTPTLISGGAAGPVTSRPMDLHGYLGIASLDVTSCTNAAGGTLALAVQTSSDTNTWTTLASAAYATTTTQLITNNSITYVGTNVVLLPGVVTTPTAASAGFATSYMLPAPYTNSVSALTITANGIYKIGFNIADVGRYVRIVISTGGTATNSTVSAALTARKASFP